MDISQLFKDFLTQTSLAAMLTVAGIDFLAGIYEAIQNKNFNVSLLPLWLQTKIVYGILPVVAMYAAALGLADPFKSTLAGFATAGAATFILAQTKSIYGHFAQPLPKDYEALHVGYGEADDDAIEPAP